QPATGSFARNLIYSTKPQKDLNLALQSAKALALNLPNTATCQELFNTCAANGGSELDHSSLIQALELMANHQIA
ncbi:NAD-binding protein, partial [Klebsiella pneumoniae]